MFLPSLRGRIENIIRPIQAEVEGRWPGKADKDRKIRAGKRDFIFLPLCSCLLSVGGLRISFGESSRGRKLMAQQAEKDRKIRTEKWKCIFSSAFILC
jgi:hypothetical protein